MFRKKSNGSMNRFRGSEGVNPYSAKRIFSMSERFGKSLNLLLLLLNKSKRILFPVRSARVQSNRRILFRSLVIVAVVIAAVIILCLLRGCGCEPVHGKNPEDGKLIIERKTDQTKSKPVKKNVNQKPEHDKFVTDNTSDVDYADQNSNTDEAQTPVPEIQENKKYDFGTQIEIVTDK